MLLLCSFEIHISIKYLWLEFDLSSSLMVKCKGAIGLPLDGFLLFFYGNKAWLGSFERYKASKFEWPWIWPFKVTQGQMQWCKFEWFPPWVRGKTSTKNEVAWFNIVWDILSTDTHTDRQTPPPPHTHRQTQSKSVQLMREANLWIGLVATGLYTIGE